MSGDWFFFIMLVMKIIKKWLLNGGVHKLAMMCNRPVNLSPFLEKCGVGVWNKGRKT